MDDIECLNLEYLQGRKVCATGRLVAMTHGELARLVSACGGTFIPTPRKCGFLLVVGDGGWPKDDLDDTANQVFRRARRLKACGYNIELTSEEDFLDRLGLSQSAGAIRGPHTIGDLSKMLEISSVRLRRWLRAGLIHPTSTQFQIPYFDFHQVAFIKHLHESIEQGASTAGLRRGLEQCREFLPHGDSLYTQWTNIERDGRVLLRLRDRLIDQTGQRYLDFDALSDEESTVFATSLEAGFHDLCDEALALEEEGHLEEATVIYRRALELKPDNATLHYDLGNVLFQLGQTEASLANFSLAVDADPEFAMAWHNLGSVHAQQGDWKQAEAALREALSLLPTYADSHFTLAAVLRKLGRPIEAGRHDSAYHEFSQANSPLATRAQLLRVVHGDEESAS
jgi:tetratricopeptide (TPR) repeat protein